MQAPFELLVERLQTTPQTSEICFATTSSFPQIKKKTVVKPISQVKTSMHFAISERLENVENLFMFEKKELIQDVYFQCPTASLTMEGDIWSKTRYLHVYSGKEIDNTFETVIIKHADGNEYYNHLSTKVELPKEEFFQVVTDDIFDLDFVQTMRFTYLFKHDQSIKLIIGSTIIKENMYYNHGTLRSSTGNEEQMLNILSNFSKSIGFPQRSPVVLRLKTNGKLPSNIKVTESNHNIGISTTGLYYEEEEEEVDEFEEFDELERADLLTEIKEMKEKLANIIKNPIEYK